MRPNRSGLLEATAECETCGWENYARNATGTAAQHAKRNPTHKVRATSTVIMIWDPR